MAKNKKTTAQLIDEAEALIARLMESEGVTDDDLDAQDRLRRTFDVRGLANPSKVLPTGASCGHVSSLSNPPADLWI